MPSAYSILVRANNGMTWAAIFNYLPEDMSEFGSELDNGLWQALAEVTQFPDGDLFSQFIQ